MAKVAIQKVANLPTGAAMILTTAGGTARSAKPSAALSLPEIIPEEREPVEEQDRQEPQDDPDRG